MNSLAKKTYYILAAFVLLIVAAAVAVIWPLINQIEHDSQTIAQEKQLTDSFFKDWADLENYKQDYSQIQNEITNTSILLPSNQAIDFIKLVENFAQATNNQETISVLTNKPTETGEKKIVNSQEQPINFQVTLKGSFPNLIKFLIHLENAPYANTVNSIQINHQATANLGTTKNNTGSGSGDISTVINLSVYTTAQS